MVDPKVSVIATTYNQSKDLALYLLSLQKQTFQDFEILIADDGSSPETREVIEAARSRFFGDRINHVWHNDLGYRKSKILNAAIRQTRAGWIIFTDSDLVVNPFFIQDHLNKKAPRGLFMGRRVDLNGTVSDWIRQNPDTLFSREFYLRILASGSFGKFRSRNLNRAFRVASPTFRRILKSSDVRDLLGSNFSIDRDLLFEINGFDESLEHYWGEDGDLFIRARNAGASIEGLKNYAVQFHLWHPVRAPQKDAEYIYKQNLMNQKYKRCLKGISLD